MGLNYVARKPLRVGGRTIQPGEVVPEAAGWKNVRAYVNDGSLAIAVAVPEGAVEDAELKAQVATLTERVAALEALVAGTGDSEGDVEVTPSSTSREDDLPGFLDAEELGKMKRSELETLAVEIGVEHPDDKSVYPNIDALVAKLVTIPVTVPADDEGGA